MERPDITKILSRKKAPHSVKLARLKPAAQELLSSLGVAHIQPIPYPLITIHT